MARRRRLVIVIGAVLAMLVVGAVVAFTIAGGGPAGNSDAADETPTSIPGQEVDNTNPPGDAPTSLPLPPTDDDPLVTRPLPKSGAAEGELVPGFPSDLLPTPAGATVISSSVATEGDHMQAGVAATSTLTPDEVVAFYRAAYASLGLTDRPMNAIPGSSAYAFSRGDNTITLTVTPAESGSAFSLFGAFRAG
ncbi:hypothetical protein [Cryobacterium sp. BB307]|uniref:hypothetical protein n=1 Tax=Cryobacterium sp. BB307 TaxID=2716317 RepID=UPI001446B012|nr:hypothetical protein [Cryobacterium sp. BB307]